jgi:hypothetical protein
MQVTTRDLIARDRAVLDRRIAELRARHKAYCEAIAIVQTQRDRAIAIDATSTDNTRS